MKIDSSTCMLRLDSMELRINSFVLFVAVRKSTGGREAFCENMMNRLFKPNFSEVYKCGKKAIGINPHL